MTAKSKPAPRTSTGRRRKRKSFLAGLSELAGMTYFGHVLLVLVLAAAIVLLNILFSRNQFDLFFLLAGIELILTGIIFWLRFILRRET
jgi:hypothetical protein